ncbi:MAG: hypothetical protein R3C17_12970 [Planctomycetaceae bacterium]
MLRLNNNTDVAVAAITDLDGHQGMLEESKPWPRADQWIRVKLPQRVADRSPASDGNDIKRIHVAGVATPATIIFSTFPELFQDAQTA